MIGEPYSPARRTALVLSGVGTAGAYHAGVLRALHEAGVKLDVVAGRGVGAVGAIFTAVDGAQRLWDEKGLWRSAAVPAAYGWRPMLRVIVTALIASVAIIAVPIFAIALGLVVFPIDFVLKIAGASSGGGLVADYLAFANRAFAADALPTWLPRLVLIVLGAAAVAGFAAAASMRDARRRRGSLWWRVVRGPLTSERLVKETWTAMWELLRGAAALESPSRSQLAQRYSEMLADNIGQPGFRELLIAAHDIDARRDIIFTLVAESRRVRLMRRQTTDEANSRAAEVIDLAGVGREHLVDALAAALAVPLVSDAHSIRFEADSFWRGETHRLCDRPSVLWRILQELAGLDVEQVILVSGAPDSGSVHTLMPARIDGRGHLGEYLQSSESALVRDASHTPPGNIQLFTIRPGHNPIGPFDFGGGFDDRSDRRETLAELMSRGYEDAYRQFIEPVVGASGETVGAIAP